MGGIWRDLRHGMRQLADDKAFFSAALLTLALGIGATITILTLVHAVLLQSVPYKEPERLVILRGSLNDEGGAQAVALSQMDLADWRERNTVFADVSVWGTLAFNLEQGEKSEHLSAELVNESYFSLLGIKPALGRFFLPEEDVNPLEKYVVVLGYDLWRSSFGADPEIVGRMLRFNGKSYQVVGVAPQGFHGLSDEAKLWVPSMLPPVRSFLASRGLRWALGVARLKPGVGVSQAQEDLKRIAAALETEAPDTNHGFGATVAPLNEFLLGSLRSGLLILSVGAALLLLIACINVGNLLLTRAAARQRAWSIQIALGAGRGLLIRQMLTESILLSLLGAGAGFLLAQWATRALIAASGIKFPSFVRIGVSPEVIGATLGLAVICGVAFGLAPIAVSFRSNLTACLGRSEKLPPSRSWFRFQNLVVVVQVALAFTLSVSSLLLAKSFRELISEDLGLDARGLLTFRIDLRGPKYEDEKVVTDLLRQQYLPRIAAVPGVGQLAMSDPTLPTDPVGERYFTIEDHDSDTPAGMYPFKVHAVSPGYFELLGIPILSGRGFDAHDTDNFAAIVSAELARQQWPGENPIGKRLKMGPRTGGRPWLNVVGVAAEARHEGFGDPSSTSPTLYVSLMQFIFRPPLTVNFLVRPKPGVPLAGLQPALRQEMRAIDPEVPDYDMVTMEERFADQTRQESFQLILINVFAFLALTLAAIGIYGVVSYGVLQRKGEIAVRMSLGADRGSIFRLVLARGAALTAVGLVLGLAAVFVLRPLLANVLYKTPVFDPILLIGACVGLFLMTLLANFVPARRAATQDPIAGLR